MCETPGVMYPELHLTDQLYPFNCLKTPFISKAGNGKVSYTQILYLSQNQKKIQINFYLASETRAMNLSYDDECVHVVAHALHKSRQKLQQDLSQLYT